VETDAGGEDETEVQAISIEGTEMIDWPGSIYPPVIISTVGRVVHYMPGSDPITEGRSDEPLAAMIVHVWGPELVNLVVFDSNGLGHSRTSVLLDQGGNDSLPSAGYCCWMDYQKGQAAKTEQLEAELDHQE